MKSRTDVSFLYGKRSDEYAAAAARIPNAVRRDVPSSINAAEYWPRTWLIVGIILSTAV
jgi:hypothetical protein